MAQTLEVTFPQRDSDEGSNGQAVDAAIFTKDEIQSWLVDHIAQLLQLDREEVDPHQPFDRFGIDSLAAVQISRGLEGLLGSELPLTLIDEFSAIEDLADFLASDKPDDLTAKLESLKGLRTDSPDPDAGSDPYENHSEYSFLDPVYIHKTEVIELPRWTPPSSCFHFSGGFEPPINLSVDCESIGKVLKHFGICPSANPAIVEQAIENTIDAFSRTGLELHLCAHGGSPDWYWKMNQDSALEGIMQVVLNARQRILDEQIFPVDHSSFERRSIITSSTANESFRLLIEDLAKTIGVFDHGHINPLQLSKELSSHLQSQVTSKSSDFQIEGRNQSLLVSELTTSKGDRLMVSGLMYEYAGSIDAFAAREIQEVKSLSWRAERWSVCFTSKDLLMEVYEAVEPHA